MKVIAYAEVSAADWDAVCDQSNEAWLFHRSDWISLETAHFGYVNRSFALIERGRVVAVQPLYISDSTSGAADELLLHCGIHRHTGLACLSILDSGLRHAAQAEAMNHITKLARSESAHRIQLNSQNLAPANRGPGREEIPFWVLDHGFYLGLNCSPTGIAPAPGMATCNADQIVNLLDSEDQLFSKLDESCRRAVRKANAAKLEFRIAEDESAVSRYYELAKRSAGRTGESLAPISYFEGVWKYLKPQGRCALAFAQHAGRDVAALLIGIDKNAGTFLGGVSDPDALQLRVNDFIHYQSMLWLKSMGAEAYRLGPVFPEVPDNWPIARVSRFKKKFGGRSVPIIQGSYFLSPERYLERGRESLSQKCAPHNSRQEDASKSVSDVITIVAPEEHRDAISIILNCYGLAQGTFTFSDDLQSGAAGQAVIFLSSQRCNQSQIETRIESRRQYVYHADQRTRWWQRRALYPVYRTLLPHITFNGPNIEPLLVTEHGHVVMAWQKSSDERTNLLIGLNVIEEIVRYRQGDPAKVDSQDVRSGFGFDFERPYYLYRDQIDLHFPHFPWVDRLGFFLVEQIARMGRIPLLGVLPDGLKGAVILTGDDDQAYLEKYDEQLSCIKDLPITYFLVHQTRHTTETLCKLPKRVEIGVHPDALDDPLNYDNLCRAQTDFIRSISKQSVQTVRNHGFLNRGYLGHLKAWENAGLIADVNCPGTDGTALNGSLLPMRIRRPDGSWSDHVSLLTAFGDGMIFGHKFSARDCLKKIRRTVEHIERSNPGVLVFNLHPQNVSETRFLHEEAVKLAARKGWGALRLGDFVKWSIARSQIRLEQIDGTWRLVPRVPTDSLVLKVPMPNGWRNIAIQRVAESGLSLGPA